MQKAVLLTLFMGLSFLKINAQTTTTLFEDDFETPQTWNIFEELVSGNMCYGDNIGEVARSIDHPQTGTNGLRVWANKNGTVKSNHVIGSHIVYPTQGITGRLRYGTWAYAASAIGFTQSGPEISVQNTRPVDGVNMTYIAGVQYIGNQWVTNKWRIWHNATWVDLTPSEISADLITNTWYYIEMEFDFTSNTYISLKIQGGLLNVNLDLTQTFTNAATGFKIGAEARSWDASLFVTAESENLWSTCSQVHENKVYYDNVSLKQVEPVLRVELTDFQAYTEGGKNYLFWTIETDKNSQNIDIERSVDGVGFNKIATIQATKNDYLDDSFFSKINYYRLKINELDNNYHYSKTLSVNNETYKKIKIRLDTEGGLFVENEEKDPAELTLFNSVGQLVYAQNNLLGHSMFNLSYLKSGLYIAQIQIGRRMESVKLLKKS